MNRTPKKRQQGIALVLVLSFLVLLTALIVGFFVNVRGELQSARMMVDDTNCRQLADSATQLVLAQIREATSAGGSTAWASQPGMIRTYGTGTAASSAPLAAYKLYSSNRMVMNETDLAGNTWDPAAEIPTDWPQKSAFFADLNAPVLRPDSGGSISLNGRTYAASYPILDPSAQGTIEGFSLVNPPGYTPNANNNPAVRSANPAPMPVRWIYVLKDGTMTTPVNVDATGAIASWTGGTIAVAKIPTAKNPIVGRVAFWADDDSSKINLNTAAGDLQTLAATEAGSFWDQPRVYNNFDLNLADSQVSQNEFQRYPGHPATISLSTVFPGLSRQEIAKLAPRVPFGGSQGGTVGFISIANPLPRKNDRLYASVDELMFQMPTTNAAERTENLPSIVTSDALEKGRFFLTAHSRSPDVNLFGRPRISIWPIHEVDASSTRNASDNLLAFCSRIGGNRFHFTRGTLNGETSTDQELDYTANSRNQQLYQYLQTLTSAPVPGFAGSSSETFEQKYTTLERDQILTEIFDYIRCTNLQDAQLNSVTNGRPFTPKKGTPGSGQVIPIKITTLAGDTHGFGRVATISEAALVFYATAYTPAVPASGSIPAKPEKTTKMRAALLFETFSPAQGHSGLVPKLSHKVTGLENMTITLESGQKLNLNFPAAAENRFYRSSGIHARIWSGTEGISNCFYQTSGARKTTPGVDPEKNYPFISQADIDVSGLPDFTSSKPSPNPSFSLDPATVTLSVGYPDSEQVVQTITLKFEQVAKLPLPARPENDKCLDFSYRIKGLPYHYNNTGPDGENWTMIVDPSDVIRSLEPKGVQGDFRLVAASGTNPTAFQPHANYAGSAVQAHSLRLGVGFRYPYLAPAPYGRSRTNPPTGTVGKLVSTVTYPGDGAPDMPSSITNGARLTNKSGQQWYGDWDTGMAAYLDGPYINKPDEGTTSPASGSTDTTPYFTNTDDFNARSLYSPNRQAFSPVSFGSLSTGVIRQMPWQTLLFHPDPNGRHPGTESPKDFLLLDLFTMPIVEPYAISEPASTAGKVNMNFQIAPFGYIRRETAMRAALESTWTMAIPTGAGGSYKSSSAADTNYRYRIDATQTLSQFQDRFDDHRIFVSPAELCDLELVPKGAPGLPTTGDTATAMKVFWNANLLTGDNVREMPYSHLYPLLTTKSNTFTVHVRAQALQQHPNGNVAEWNEGRDHVLSEYRGSSVVERYIDPDDPLLPDFATTQISDPKGNMENYYRMRIIRTHKFTP